VRHAPRFGCASEPVRTGGVASSREAAGPTGREGQDASRQEIAEKLGENDCRTPEETPQKDGLGGFEICRFSRDGLLPIPARNGSRSRVRSSEGSFETLMPNGKGKGGRGKTNQLSADFYGIPNPPRKPQNRGGGRILDAGPPTVSASRSSATNPIPMSYRPVGTPVLQRKCDSAHVGRGCLLLWATLWCDALWHSAYPSRVSRTDSRPRYSVSRLFE